MNSKMTLWIASFFGLSKRYGPITTAAVFLVPWADNTPGSTSGVAGD